MIEEVRMDGSGRRATGIKLLSIRRHPGAEMPHTKSAVLAV